MNAVVIVATLLIFAVTGFACCRLTSWLDSGEQTQIVCEKQRLNPSVIYVHRQRRKAQTASAGINVDASLVWKPKTRGFRAGWQPSQPI